MSNVITVSGGKSVFLGRQGENLATLLRFPIKRWLDMYGPGDFFLVHQREGDEAPYPVAVTFDEQYVYWPVTTVDVAVEGYGVAELSLTVGSTVVKSEIYTTQAGKALGEAGELPEPWEAWVDEMRQAQADVLNKVPSITGAEGKFLHVKSDGSGTEWADGAGGSVDFDNLFNRPGYNGHAMSHQTDIPEVKTETWDAKYSKPNTGIPKSDLTQGVQDSLDLADTALQEHQSLANYRTASEQDARDNGKESNTNKVTSVSSTSTDVQYPSAKAVYEAIQAMYGRIIDLITSGEESEF